jgi:hypothetical protein
MTAKKELMSNRIFSDSIDLDYKIFEKVSDLIEVLKKHKVSNWKTKDNQHKLIHEVDFLITSKYAHMTALDVVEEIEKKEKAID